MQNTEKLYLPNPPSLIKVERKIMRRGIIRRGMGKEENPVNSTTSTNQVNPVNSTTSIVLNTLTPFSITVFLSLAFFFISILMIVAAIISPALFCACMVIIVLIMASNGGLD